MPVEPAPSVWDFGESSLVPGSDDLVALGADLAPGTLLAAYRKGLFPMPSGRFGGAPAWFSPELRGVIPVPGLRVTRSLRRSAAMMEIRIDTAFDAVIDGCADPDRPGGWIDAGIHAAYRTLHDLGWAHSVETWHEGRLVGGLYGVAIGGLFAGESMFHRERDASKVALLALVERLSDAHAADRLLDVQWLTPHLASLGAVELPREEYLARLRVALTLPRPAAFAGCP